MNPSFPNYRGRFVLLWHELPASPKSSLEIGNDRDLRQNGKGSYLRRKMDSLEDAAKSPIGPDEDPHSGQRSYKNHSHWDLMLELDSDELLTWRLPGLPLTELLQKGRGFNAARLPNHRSVYLDYEGPVSGNRGWVKRIALGEYHGAVLNESANLRPSEVQDSTVSSSLGSGFTSIPSELSKTGAFLQVSLQGQLDKVAFSCVLQMQLTSVDIEVRFKVIV